MVIFALMWLGEAFLVLKFLKWVIHGSALVYLLLVPWTLFGLIMVVRPNWVLEALRERPRNFTNELEHYSKNARHPVFLR